MGKLIINFRERIVKGTCKKKELKGQFLLLQDLIIKPQGDVLQGGTSEYPSFHPCGDNLKGEQ